MLCLQAPHGGIAIDFPVKSFGPPITKIFRIFSFGKFAAVQKMVDRSAQSPLGNAAFSWLFPEMISPLSRSNAHPTRKFE